MEDLQFTVEEETFGVRAMAIIYNKAKTKVLLFRMVDRDHYILPGGRIKFNENSLDGIKREIKEELGWDNIDFKFKTTGEEFGYNEYKQLNYHQISLVYEGIYFGEIKEGKFNGFDGDWCYFEWIDIEKIDEVVIRPVTLKEMLKGEKKHIHFIINNL